MRLSSALSWYVVVIDPKVPKSERYRSNRGFGRWRTRREAREWARANWPGFRYSFQVG